MSGFGKGLKMTKVDCRLLHKTKLEWISELIRCEDRDRGLCCSTPDSERLFSGRDAVVVFSAKTREGFYDPSGDADYGAYLGYDEFLLENFSIDEIEEIILAKDAFSFCEKCAEGWEEGDEEMECLADYTVKHYASFYFDFYAKIRVVEEAEKSFINF